MVSQAGNPGWDTIHLKQNNQGIWIANGLQPSTTYKWTVSTHCGNEGVWSVPVLPWGRFTTLAAPCTTPDSLMASPVGVDKAKLNWINSVGAVKVIIRWRMQGGAWTYVKKDGTKDFHWLSGLASSTTYEWQITTQCSADNTANTPWSSLQTFTTAPSAKQGLYGTGPDSEGTALVLFPNPASDQLNVKVADPHATGSILISVYDATGKVVHTVQESLNQGVTTTTFDVSGFPKGMYLVRITGAITGTTRLVVE